MTTASTISAANPAARATSNNFNGQAQTPVNSGLSGLVGAVPNTAPNHGQDVVPEDELTPFMKALMEFWKLPAMPVSVAESLKDVTLGNVTDDALHAKFGDADVTFTQHSVTTTSKMTPELALQMAAAASLRFQTDVELKGSPEAQQMLLWASQHYKLGVDKHCLECISLNISDELKARLKECEACMGMPNVCDSCFGPRAPQATAPTAAPTAKRTHAHAAPL